MAARAGRRTTKLLATGVLAAATALATAGTALAKTDLVLAIAGEPEQGFDPLLGWGQYGHPLFQSTLLVRDADLQTQPDLATAWTLSPDRLAWTVEIRDDAKFSDGSALTAEDVAFTFATAKNAGGTVDLAVMESAEAVGPNTVEIRLSEPKITFVEAFYTLGIVPAASYGEDYARQPVGSGPYKLVNWTEGEQLIVEANEHFHGEAPEFQRIVFLFTEEDTSFAAASAGELDIVSVPPTLADSVPSGMRRVVAQTVDNRGLMFPMLPDEGRTTADGIAIGNDVTADPAIREAINAGVDREALVEVALLGHGTPAFGPADGLPWSHPEGAVTASTAEDANAILDEAGWTLGEDGVRRKGDLEARFRITYPANDSTREALAIAVSEMVRPLGIVAEPTGRSWDDIRRVAKHSDAILYGWGSHTPLEVNLLYGSAFAGVESYNSGFYANEAVDRYFAEAQAAETLEASFPLWSQAEWDGTTGFGMRGDAAWAWLVNLDHVYFVSECLDVGRTQIEPHGHGWPITASILGWRWTCP